MGKFEQENGTILFKGGEKIMQEGQPTPEIGNFICDHFFGGGIISGEIEFIDSVEMMVCEFILFYDPSRQAFTTVGLGSGVLCSVRTWTGAKFITHASAGNRDHLVPNRSYLLHVSVQGSRVIATVDGVNILNATLPFSLPRGQPGIWCLGKTDIRVKNYKVTPQREKCFVVMQFTPPYNELYNDVIIPVCNELGLDVVRADETYGPGLIIADIAREIIEAKLIIADITPANPNVYYEVGYAHAQNKPTILIAEKPTELPFDVSPFRVLFYENTIGGKSKVEEGLRKHLKAIQTQWAV